MKPLVSAVIPSYNRVGTIRRAVDSAIQQLDSFVEVIVVDDGSTDATMETLLQYGSRIKIIHQHRGGAAAARNAGIDAATGEHIAFLDSDDEWLPEKTRVQLEYFAANAGLGILACSALFMQDNRVYDIHWSRRAEPLHKRLFSGPVNTSGVMINTMHLRDLGSYFRTDLPVYEDSELWWRLSARHQSLIIPDVLVKSHRESESISTSISIDAKIRAIDRYYDIVLQDDQVRRIIGSDVRRFVADRHYIASCSYYISRQRIAAYRRFFAFVKENPFDARWLKLAGVISLPPNLRPYLKRIIGRIARLGA
jgi:glycosyltransferase involved in cell wall biosynthesis